MSDLAIRGGQVASVATGEVFEADVVLRGGAIAAVIPPGDAHEAREVIDARGLVVVPGLIDAHMHVESSFLTPAPFAWLSQARGTTTVLADPHEIANVAGEPGIRWMISEARRARQTMLFAIPSCVPALPGFETAGAELGVATVERLANEPEVVALGEVMDYRAVVAGNDEILDKVTTARRLGLLVDGHCPGLEGADLQAYLAAGIDSDHTKNAPGVVLEKLRLGMTLMLQEKAITAEVIGAMYGLPLPPPVCLVTDDSSADFIAERGHLERVARAAVSAGMSPEHALRAVTLAPATRLQLADRGVVAAGKRADLVLVSDLATLEPRMVIIGGRLVARDGRSIDEEPAVNPHEFGDSVRLDAPLSEDFEWSPGTTNGSVALRAIRVNALDTTTVADVVQCRLRDGRLELPAGVGRLACVHRHGRSPNRAMAPITGMSLGEDGAVATTYAHDSHNLLVLGTSTRAMAAAAAVVVRSAGGMAVVRGEEVVASLPLPVGGVMSDRPVSEVVGGAHAVRNALDEWGYQHANALMSLTTLALPVSPLLKLTDRGLVDVGRREAVSSVL